MGRKTVYNYKLVTNEVWEQVNPDNKDLMEDFMVYLGSIGRSQKTITQYKNDLKIFFCWYVKNGKNKFFVDITKREIMRYQGFLIGTCKMSSSRVRRLRSSLSSLSGYVENMLDEDFPDFRNIVNKIEAPAQNPVRDKLVFKIDKCLKVCDELMKQDAQASALFAVACFSGLRKSELTRLKYEDFTTNKNMALDGGFYVTSKIKIKGKGDRLEKKFVWVKCDKWLQNWIKYREDNGINSEYLFCYQKDEEWHQLDKSQMDGFVYKIEKFFDGNFYFHACRHFFASFLTESGIPLRICQFLLSHKSSEVTQLYIDIDEEDNLNGFEDFFTGKANKAEKGKSLNDL